MTELLLRYTRLSIYVCWRNRPSGSFYLMLCVKVLMNEVMNLQACSREFPSVWLFIPARECVYFTWWFSHSNSQKHVVYVALKWHWLLLTYLISYSATKTPTVICYDSRAKRYEDVEYEDHLQYVRESQYFSAKVRLKIF